MGTNQYVIVNKSVAVFLNDLSMAEKLKVASLNTLVGLLTVFTVLIVIICLIFLLKYIPRLLNMWSRKSDHEDYSDYSDRSFDNVKSHIVANEEEEFTTDTELIAVITAAIHASLGDSAPADGLIVRSIRKVNTRRR